MILLENTIEAKFNKHDNMIPLKSLLSFFFVPKIDKQLDQLQRIPFGISSLDSAFRGIPKGGIIEICGETGSGRTSFALQIAKNIQRLNGFSAIIDSHNHQPDHLLARTQVISSDILYSYITDLDTCINITIELMKSDIDLIIIDEWYGFSLKKKKNQTSTLSRIEKELRRLAMNALKEQKNIIIITDRREENSNYQYLRNIFRFYSFMQIEISKSDTWQNKKKVAIIEHYPHYQKVLMSLE